MTSKNEMDALAGDVLATIDILTDEVQETRNGSTLDIHYIGGNPNRKLVLGSSRKGKTVFTVCPTCNAFINKKDGISVDTETWCCSEQCVSSFETN